LFRSDLTLRLIADAGDITIGDGEEGGWAIRTIPTLRRKGAVATGRLLSSEGDTDGEAAGWRAAWVDCHGSDRAGDALGIALFDQIGRAQRTQRLIPDAGDITAGGGDEGGCAIRTIPTVRREGAVATGRLHSSEGDKDGEAAGWRAAWVDCHGSDRAGNALGIALFD